MAAQVPDIPTELVSAGHERRLVLFAGAGVSRGRTRVDGKDTEQYLPTWGGLLVVLAERAVRDGYLDEREAVKLRKAVGDGKYLFVAEALRRRLGASAFDGALDDIFRDPRLQPTRRHDLITQVPFASIVTTNYDKLLEAAYAQRGYLPPAYTFDDSSDAIAAVGHNRFFILKAHGDIDRKESLVLSERDYRDVVYREPGYRAVLNTIFMTRTVLFIGTSMSDTDVNLVLESANEAFRGKGPKHYALVPMADAPEDEVLHWRDYFGIHLIRYRATKAHPQVDRFLEVLADKISKYQPQRSSPA